MRFYQIIFLFIFISCQALAAEPIQLLAPEKTGGKPLMSALNERQSTRSFSDRVISMGTLSNLLWAASGVNRSDGKRTAPSAGDSRAVDIYVALKRGVYRYDAVENILEPILDDDIRAMTGRQDFTQQAPVNLIYVANLDKISYGGQKDFYSATDTGFISQNVYLFCASEGLATVVLGWVDKEALGEKMGLSEAQRVILTQPVGYPGE